MLSLEVEKVNRKRVAQGRILLVTTHFLYNIKPKSLFTKAKIRNKFSISALTTVIYSKLSWDMILSFPMHFDLHFRTEVKDTILQFIF
jgi:hypothetical protein